MFIPSLVFSQVASPRKDGGVDITCPSGRTAVVKLEGTMLNISITETNGTVWGMMEEPSGGSSDPKIVIGDGSNLSKRVCEM